MFGQDGDVTLHRPRDLKYGRSRLILIPKLPTILLLRCFAGDHGSWMVKAFLLPSWFLAGFGDGTGAGGRGGWGLVSFNYLLHE